MLCLAYRDMPHRTIHRCLKMNCSSTQTHGYHTITAPVPPEWSPKQPPREHNLRIVRDRSTALISFDPHLVIMNLLFLGEAP